MASTDAAQKTKEPSGLLSKAFTDGIRIGRSKYRSGERIDLYKAPMIRVKPSDAFLVSTISSKLMDSRMRISLDKIVASRQHDE